MLRSQLLRTVRSVHVTPCSQRTLLRQFATGANPTGNTNKSGTQGTGANNEGAGLGTGPRQSTYQNSNVKGQPLNPSANQGQHATKHSQTANVSGQQQKPLPSAGTPDAVGASPKGSEQSINAETKPHHNKHPNARNAGNHNTNKSGTQGTGANNEGAGLGTGSRQSTNENSDVKGQPLNPSAHQGQPATKHSQTANVSGQQQKPLPSAGTPDAVGASPKGSEQSINAETKPQHNMQSNAGNHNQASHSQSSHNASHSNHKDTSHQSHSTNKVSHSQESPASSSSDQHASSSVGTMDLANASAKAKEKAQDIKNKVQNMIQEAGHELPEGNSFIFMGSAVLAAVIFMMVNPDYRYLKHVYKVDEKPRIEAIQHPTLH